MTTFENPEIQIQNPRLDADEHFKQECKRQLTYLSYLIEKRSNSRAERARASWQDKIEETHRWFDLEGVKITYQYGRWTLVPTEGEKAELKRQMVEYYQKDVLRDIEKMYTHLHNDLERIKEIVDERIEACAQKNAHSLTGSNDFDVYTREAWALMQKLDQTEILYHKLVSPDQ